MSYVAFRVPSKGAFPPGSPHRAPKDRDAPFLQPSFICFSKSPVKWACLQAPQQGPYGDSCLFPEPSVTCLTEFPVNKVSPDKITSYFSLNVPGQAAPPSMAPNRAPLARVASFQSLPLHIPEGPQQRSPPPCSPHRAPTEWKRCSISRALLYLSLGVPAKQTSLQVPQWGPYEERCPFPELSFTDLLESPINKVSW